MTMACSLQRARCIKHGVNTIVEKDERLGRESTLKQEPMAHVTLSDLTSDWCDDTMKTGSLMPRPSAVRNILAYSAGTRMISTERLGSVCTPLN